MRIEINLSTGETTEHEDAPATPAPAQTPAEQLAALDAQNALTQRKLRETVMLMAEAFKTITNGQVDLSAIPGVAKVYQVESEAEALRALL
jgi:aryl-alcohol dehydrogenase-like predicted oxidoreductase